MQEVLGALILTIMTTAFCGLAVMGWVKGEIKLGGYLTKRSERPIRYYYTMMVLSGAAIGLLWLSWTILTRTVLSGH